MGIYRSDNTSKLLELRDHTTIKSIKQQKQRAIKQSAEVINATDDVDMKDEQSMEQSKGLTWVSITAHYKSIINNIYQQLMNDRKCETQTMGPQDVVQ